MILPAAVLISVFIAGVCLSQETQPADDTQATYESPEAAVDAMAQAVFIHDRKQLRQVFGPRMSELASGSPQQDGADMQRLAAAMNRGYRLEDAGPGEMEVLIGPDEWQFPVPLIQEGERWRFDTDTGIEEIIDCRVGKNELDAIATCKYLAAAEEFYYEKDPDQNGVNSYATRMASTPGKRDGLYWPVEEGELQSPLGPVVTAAMEKGELKQPGAAGQRQPYRGYFYKILTRQGPAAPGGDENYVDADGWMTGGFAILAWPAVYDRTGVMSFMIAKDGVVYQADLGDDTQQAADAIDAFNPDSEWSRVEQPTTAPADAVDDEEGE